MVVCGGWRDCVAGAADKKQNRASNHDNTLIIRPPIQKNYFLLFLCVSVLLPAGAARRLLALLVDELFVREGRHRPGYCCTKAGVSPTN